MEASPPHTPEQYVVDGTGTRSYSCDVSIRVTTSSWLRCYIGRGKSHLVRASGYRYSVEVKHEQPLSEGAVVCF